jgi:hypothetical protein
MTPMAELSVSHDLSRPDEIPCAGTAQQRDRAARPVSGNRLDATEPTTRSLAG